jgi:O-acetyl-ADP-ribose deacetylase (regulator of RNase III)
MKYIIGNLIDLALDGQFDMIAHGCNCFKNFGAGIALEIKHRIPKAYNIDLNFHNPSLGDYSHTILQIAVKTDIGFKGRYLRVVNCYTQFSYGRPYSENNKTIYPFDTAEARYDAIRNCFKGINEQFKGLSIGLPLIGCGLAGLEWKTVEKIIQEELNLLDVTIVVFNESERLKNNITLTQ